MENEFTKVMSERTDKELVKIVTVERDKYQPLAIEAAESEIEKRNIDTSDFEKIREKATTEKKQKQKVTSDTVQVRIRFVNFIIDTLIWIIIISILTFPLNANNENEKLIGYLIMFLTFIGYYAFMEIRFQKTVGKYITKTKVVKMNGEKPKNEDIIARTFCRLIPFDRLSFLYTRNGFHDYLSNTKVVKDNMK